MGCTLVLLTACRRKSLPWLPPPSRLRSLLLLSVSTPYGSVAPSCPHCPPSRPCGSPRRSTTSPAPASSTASASKLALNHCYSFLLVVMFISTERVYNKENLMYALYVQQRNNHTV